MVSMGGDGEVVWCERGWRMGVVWKELGLLGVVCGWDRGKGGEIHVGDGDG